MGSPLHDALLGGGAIKARGVSITVPPAVSVFCSNPYDALHFISGLKLLTSGAPFGVLTFSLWTSDHQGKVHLVPFESLHLSLAQC